MGDPSLFFQKGFCCQTGVKPRFRASSRFRSPFFIPELRCLEIEWMDLMSKIFASHHPAWGHSDFWFRCELIYGSAGKPAVAFYLQKAGKTLP